MDYKFVPRHPNITEFGKFDRKEPKPPKSNTMKNNQLGQKRTSLINFNKK